MGIFLRHSYNVKPPRWGSPADVQYAIKVNAEKIYGVNFDHIAYVLPMFWGFPLQCFSQNGIITDNHGTIFKDGSLNFTDDYLKLQNDGSLNFGTGDYTILFRLKASAILNDRFLIGFRPWVATGLHITTSAAGALRMAGISGGEISSTTLLDDGCWHSSALRRTGTAVDIFVDGVLENSGTDNDNWSFASNRPVIGVNDYNESSNYFLGDFAYAILLKTAPSNSSIRLFNILPYSLYQRVARPVYFFQAAVGGVTMPIFMSNYLRQMGA